MAAETRVIFRDQRYENTLTIAGAHTYAIGDVIAGAANSIFTFGSSAAVMNSPAAPFSFDDSVLRSNAESVARGVSLNAYRIVTSSATVAFAGEIWFFSKNMAVTDDSPLSISFADMRDYFLGHVEFLSTDWKATGSGLILSKDDVGKVLTFPDPQNYSTVTGQLFGVIVTRSAVSFVGAESISGTIFVS